MKAWLILCILIAGCAAPADILPPPPSPPSPEKGPSPSGELEPVANGTWTYISDGREWTLTMEPMETLDSQAQRIPAVVAQVSGPSDEWWRLAVDGCHRLIWAVAHNEPDVLSYAIFPAFASPLLPAIMANGMRAYQQHATSPAIGVELTEGPAPRFLAGWLNPETGILDRPWTNASVTFEGGIVASIEYPGNHTYVLSDARPGTAEWPPCQSMTLRPAAGRWPASPAEVPDEPGLHAAWAALVDAAPWFGDNKTVTMARLLANGHEWAFMVEAPGDPAYGWAFCEKLVPANDHPRLFDCSSDITAREEPHAVFAVDSLGVSWDEWGQWFQILTNEEPVHKGIFGGSSGWNLPVSRLGGSLSSRTNEAGPLENPYAPGFTLHVDARTNAIWSLEAHERPLPALVWAAATVAATDPKPEAASIKNHIAFWKGVQIQ